MCQVTTKKEGDHKLSLSPGICGDRWGAFARTKSLYIGNGQQRERAQMTLLEAQNLPSVEPAPSTHEIPRHGSQYISFLIKLSWMGLLLFKTEPVQYCAPLIKTSQRSSNSLCFFQKSHFLSFYTDQRDQILKCLSCFIVS